MNIALITTDKNTLKRIAVAILILCVSSLIAQSVYTTSEAYEHVGEYAYVKGRVYNVYFHKKGHVFFKLGWPLSGQSVYCGYFSVGCL